MKNIKILIVAVCCLSSFYSQSLSGDSDKKSYGLSILYSALLPGMGELYAGDYSSGKYYTIADGLLIGAAIGFDLYSTHQINLYKSYGRDQGAFKYNQENDEFFTNAGLYLNADDYNNAMLLRGETNSLIDKNKYDWSWSDSQARSKYRELWKKAENAKNNIRFVVGAMFVNRVISAINAVRVAKNYNKGVQLSVYASPTFSFRKVDGMEMNFLLTF